MNTTQTIEFYGVRDVFNDIINPRRIRTQRRRHAMETAAL